MSLLLLCMKVKVKGKVCIRAKWPIRPELIPVSHGLIRDCYIYDLPVVYSDNNPAIQSHKYYVSLHPD